MDRSRRKTQDDIKTRVATGTLAKTFPGFINFIGVKRKRCGSCNGCMATDCGGCGNCRDKKKFGGAGKKKQSCLKRRCVNMFSSGILFCCQLLLYLNIFQSWELKQNNLQLTWHFPKYPRNSLNEYVHYGACSTK